MEKEENTSIIDSNIVCIIGGGVSGILAMKYCKDNGLNYHLIEIKQSLLGLWSKDGLVWEEMTTNVTQYCCQFRDLLWDPKPPCLLSLEEVREYLNKYINKFDLLNENSGNKILFNTKVVKVTSNSLNKTYTINLLDINTNKESELIYSKVIVATGVNSSYEIVKFKGIDKFKGKIIHSAEYKTCKEFVDKKVLIVGFSFSGSNIAEQIVRYKQENPELSKGCDKVYVSCNQPPYVLDVLKLNESTGLVENFETTSFKRKTDKRQEYFIDDKQFKTAMGIYKTYFNMQTMNYSLTTPQLRRNKKYYDVEESEAKIRIALGNDIVKYVKEGLIKVLGPISQLLDNKTVEFKKEIVNSNNSLSDVKDEEKHLYDEFDIIIVCSGYKNDLNFLSEEIKQEIQYDYKDNIFPVVMYKGVYVHKYPNILFVGMFAGLYWTGIELQAKFAAEYLANKIKLPDNDSIVENIKKHSELRSISGGLLPRPWNFIQYNDNISLDMSCYIDLPDLLKTEFKDLYRLSMNIPVIAVHYQAYEYINKYLSLKKNDDISNKEKLIEYKAKIDEIISYLTNIEKYYYKPK